MTTDPTLPTSHDQRPDDEPADEMDQFDLEPDTDEPDTDEPDTVEPVADEPDTDESDTDESEDLPASEDLEPAEIPAIAAVQEPAPAVARRQGLIRRMLNTPLRDLARMRFSGRLDLRQYLRDAELPDELRDIVLDVVTRSRLWRIERADVGRELTTHFRDGLDRGEDVEDLAVAFGPPRQAARLIRRAKRRGRSAAWQVWLRSVQVAGVVLAVLVGIYLVATVRLFTGKPVIARNFLLEANATAAEVPADNRAWDLYREALLGLGAMPSEIIGGDAYPGSENWDVAARYVEQHGEAMELIRAGAARPGLGYQVANGIDEADRVLWPDMPVAGEAGAGQAGRLEGVASVLLPYLDSMSRLSWLLAIDALRAAELGDGSLVTANIEAITGLARQTIEVPFILNNLVAFRQVSLAVTTLGKILGDRPDVFTDQQLGRLAHRLSALFGGRLRPRLDGERMMIDDFVQRMYTDDGDGGGRLTAQGLSSLGDFSGAPDMRVGPLAPIAGLLVANRRDMNQEVDRWFAMLEAEFAKPLWRRDLTRINREIDRRAGSVWYVTRYLGMPLLMPPLSRVGTRPELVTQQRDAVCVAIALELFRRRHGSWPRSLDELVPELLPEIPPDRFDGRPIRYRLIDNNPVVYSVGADRDDDGAIPPPSSSTRFASDVATVVNDDGTARADGDWVLWTAVRSKLGESLRGEVSRRAADGDEG